MTKEQDHERALDRMTMDEKPEDLHIDLADLDDGEEPLPHKPEHDVQMAAVDELEELR